jgi:succinate dehydrogenase / fumarate reductase cytochrome b subunit
MGKALTLYRSSIGKKVVMAVTGAILVLYVVAHMVGNLKAFQGAEKLDAYAEFLREVGAPVFGHGQVLWLVRLVLLAAVVLHVVAAVQLTRLAREARPEGYARGLAPDASTLASRTMRWGGVILLLFVVYHLLHFTVGSAHPDFVPGGVYHNVTVAFRSVAVTGVYLVAMTALGLHLAHGVWSAFQTLGLNHPRYNRFRRPLAVILAVLVAAGFAAVPLAIALGLIR